MKKIILVITILGVILSCQKEENEPAPTSPDPVTDIDGNQYRTIQIGTQVWMAENLKTSKYCNGDPIQNITDDTQWVNLTTGAWSHYNNSIQYENPYGKLYNWYAVDDARNICPCNWHVPTDAEWTVLTEFLGGRNVAGGKMKSTGTQYWLSPNLNATNVSGFSGLPGGRRYGFGTFSAMSELGLWWSSTVDNNDFVLDLSLWWRYGDVFRSNGGKDYGLSVRCLKD